MRFRVVMIQSIDNLFYSVIIKESTIFLQFDKLSICTKEQLPVTELFGFAQNESFLKLVSYKRYPINHSKGALSGIE